MTLRDRFQKRKYVPLRMGPEKKQNFEKQIQVEIPLKLFYLKP